MIENALISHAEIIAYLTAGWSIAPLRCHHGTYSALAWREVTDA